MAIFIYSQAECSYLYDNDLAEAYRTKESGPDTNTQRAETIKIEAERAGAT